MITKDKYLRLLAKEYPTAAKTVTEIINLEAIMNLPKAILPPPTTTTLRLLMSTIIGYIRHPPIVP